MLTSAEEGAAVGQRLLCPLRVVLAALLLVVRERDRHPGLRSCRVSLNSFRPGSDVHHISIKQQRYPSTSFSVPVPVSSYHQPPTPSAYITSPPYHAITRANKLKLRNLPNYLPPASKTYSDPHKERLHCVDHRSSTDY